MVWIHIHHGAVGPVLGGFLIEHGSWRWAFFIYLAIAVMVLALTIRHVPESRNTYAGATLDWPGAALATVGISHHYAHHVHAGFRQRRNSLVDDRKEATVI